MSYFYSDKLLSIGKVICLENEEAKHILQSRRIKKNEIIELQDLENTRFRCLVQSINRKSLELEVIEKIAPPPESHFQINLFIGLVKEKSADTILQKVTELGIHQVHFFQSEHSQQLKKFELEKKLTRWGKIVSEACKQSGRTLKTKVSYIPNYSLLNESLSKSVDQTYILDNRTTEPNNLKQIMQLPSSTINILIGPEAGFSKKDLEKLRFPSLSFGKRVMRADTAAIFISSILQHLKGDMD